MGLFGDLVTGALGGFGSKPNVPRWNDINLGVEQGKAIDSNTAALTGSEALVSSANAFSQDQIRKMLEGAIPGFSNIVGNVSSDIESLLKGEIPQDVASAVQSNAAGRALEGGYGGSGASRSLVARDLGLTSLDLTQKGIGSAQNWMQTMNSLYAPGEINVSSMFVTPEQMFNADLTNQQNKWGVKWLHNQVAAMPDPQTAAIAKDVGGMTDSLVSSLMSSGSGAAAVGGGGGSL